MLEESNKSPFKNSLLLFNFIYIIHRYTNNRTDIIWKFYPFYRLSLLFFHVRKVLFYNEVINNKVLTFHRVLTHIILQELSYLVILM